MDMRRRECCGNGRKRALWFGVLLGAAAVPLIAGLAWAQEPPQRDFRKQITFKMRMQAAENRKQMIQAIEAQQKAAQQGQDPGNQPSPSRAPQGSPATTPHTPQDPHNRQRFSLPLAPT